MFDRRLSRYRRAAGLAGALALAACSSEATGSTTASLDAPIAFRFAVNASYAISAADAQILIADSGVAPPTKTTRLRAYDLRSGRPAWSGEVDDCKGMSLGELTPVRGGSGYVLFCHTFPDDSSDLDDAKPTTAAIVVFDAGGRAIARRRFESLSPKPSRSADFRVFAGASAVAIDYDNATTLYDLASLKKSITIPGEIQDVSSDRFVVGGDGLHIVTTNGPEPAHVTMLGVASDGALVPWSHETDAFDRYGLDQRISRFDSSGRLEWQVHVGTEIAGVAYDSANRRTYVFQSAEEGEAVPAPITCLTDSGAVAGSFVAPKSSGPAGRAGIAGLSTASGAFADDAPSFFELTPGGLGTSYPIDPHGLVADVVPELDSVVMFERDEDDRKVVEIAPIEHPAAARTIDVDTTKER